MNLKTKIEIPSPVKKVIRKITDKGFEAYIVGGVLRDMLLGRSLGDFDIATNARPKEISKIFKKTVPTGIKHGTVTVIENGRSYEVTTFRREGKYTDSRRPDKVKFIGNLTEDLSRRDFTVNAMALNIKNNTIIDPFGGIRDLKKKILRTVGDPLKRFAEDALRPIRAARFAAVLNFTIEKKTLSAIPKVLPKIKKLSSERVRDELMKMLAADKPSIGLSALHKSGVLRLIIPELARADRFDQGGMHDYDLLKHTLIATDNGPKYNPLLRLSLLLHDVGKTETRIIEGKDFHFYGHESCGAEMAKSIMKRLKFSNKEIEYVDSMIKNHMFNYNESWKDNAIRRLLARTGPDRIDDLLDLREADAKACGKNRKPSEEFYELKSRIKRIKKQDTALKVTDLKIDGNDVMKFMKIHEGKRVGEILLKLLNMVMDDVVKNKKKDLIAAIGTIKQPRPT